MIVAPSILAADFGNLARDIGAVAEGGADWIHIDVMDGHFVPNISFGPVAVQVARAATDLPLDVHLMIQDPDRYLEDFVAAGAAFVTVHQEVCPHLHRTLQRIRELGARPGVALNPGTPVESIADVVPYVDLVLIMSVNPGFGGQSYIPATTGKLSRTRALLREMGSEAHVEVDGGVSAANAAEIIGAGADALVAGSAVFRHADGPQAGVQAIRRAVAGG